MKAKNAARASGAIAVLFLLVVALLVGVYLYNGISKTNSSSTSSATIQVSPESESVTQSSAILITITSTTTFSSLDTTVDLSISCHSVNGLPDPTCTPGVTNPNVTQANIDSTICVSGWTSTVRPPESYTEPLKAQSIQQYGYADKNLSDYEYDHLIPLEVGGNPWDTRNLWAEPHYGNYTSYDKDGLENYLNAQVCDGKMTLVQAQTEIATNWVQYWIAAGKPNGTNDD